MRRAVVARSARQTAFFVTDEKRIRTRNAVMIKSKDEPGLLLHKIADCARMCFSSARNRDPRGRFLVAQQTATLQLRASAEPAATYKYEPLALNQHCARSRLGKSRRVDYNSRCGEQLPRSCTPKLPEPSHPSQLLELPVADRLS